ncbi:MAG: selenocysteine-specific translation elongation factor [Smithellaceae bacterium]|nr:selenocysteine-specific translation elongation factor [Smithellaceae bacterium]
MKHIILGTAGHVDHGKTSLIRVLTGIDTDRLKEEKERGITIELGFAHLALPSGQIIGIVDVPGHERFVRTMVAGATGIDIIALVIAADEGVMPQTREHLQICSLLGIKRGLVALTKVDLVDEEWLELVTSEVRDFLQDTFLEDAPILPLSAATGSGLDEFISTLDRIASAVEEDYDCGILRLPIDRIFTMKGFGTVVTGTLISGMVSPGDSVEILPAAIPVKIRGVQVHNQAASSAHSGQRTALNIQGAEKASLNRGDVLAQPGYLKPARRLDVYLSCLPENRKKIKHRSLVRFHTGTNEVMARLSLLDREELQPGQSCYAQLFLAAPAVGMATDRFVIRSYSPVTTVGGGEIIDPEAKKIKRHVGSLINDLEILREGTREEKVLGMITRAGLVGLKLKELTAKTGIRQEDLRPAVKSLLSKKQAILIQPEDTLVVAAAVFAVLQEKILTRLLDYHRRFPLKPGMGKEELRETSGRFIHSRLFNSALKNLENQGRLILEREIVRYSDHRIDLNDGLEKIKDDILRAYLASGLTPPDSSEVLARFSDQREKVEGVFQLLTKEGLLVRIRESYYLHRDVLSGLQDAYLTLLQERGKAAPADFKELTGVSRKYLIPLMEYFDMSKFTIRSGEYRILKSNR